MAEFIQQINQNISQLTLGKKLSLLFFLAAVTAGVVVLWLWAQTPQFQVLYSNLSPEDAGAVVDKLRESRVSYKLSGNGSTVLVPSHQVHELRLEMAGQGLPQGGGIGFEIFDRSSIGVSEFVQKLNYRRALQGELARTISQLDEVLRARVHLVIPERRLFTEQQEQARASVVVILRPGNSLEDPQIMGITYLVASSVERLKAEGVTVIDNRGKVLSKTADPGSNIQMTSTQLDLQRNLEQDLGWKIQSMLEKVVGTDKAVVRVSSTLDFRQMDLTEEKFDPNSQVARSEQLSQEDSVGTSGAGGVPGVLSNLPGESLSPSGGGSRNSSTRKSEIINYEINKSVSHMVQPAGTILRLSVATLVDGTYKTTTGEDGETSREYVPRSAEEMKKLEDLVKTAMGFSEDRGDQVVVENVPFEEDILFEEEFVAEETALPLAERLVQWMPVARYVFGLVLALVAFFLVIRPIMQALLTPAPAQFPAYAPSELPVAGREARSNAPDLQQVAAAVKGNPQAATMVVKKWMKEK